MNKLNAKALALGCGISWGVYMLLLGWIAGWWDWGTSIVTTLSSLYIGFDPTFTGGIVGGIWGFFDGAIGGAIVAWIYNMAIAKDK